MWEVKAMSVYIKYMSPFPNVLRHFSVIRTGSEKKNVWYQHFKDIYKFITKSAYVNESYVTFNILCDF